MADEKLSKVDSNDTDVEAGQDVAGKDTQKTALPSRKFDFDTGEEHVRFRHHWWQIWLPKDPPPPPPASLDDASVIPLVTSTIFAILSYTWINPIMMLGYQRTLQATDLWKMDHSRESGNLGAQLDEAWARRVQAAKEWNVRLEDGQIRPGIFKRIKWSIRALQGKGTYGERRAALEGHWRQVDGRKEASLAWTLNDVFGRDFWSGGAFKVIGDTAQLMGPLLVKAIINFGKEHAAAAAEGRTPPPIGRGIGMAIGLFCTTVTTSVCQHQFFWRSMTTGLLARAALTSSIYKRGVSLTGKARTTLPNATLVTHISTDVSRVDACAQWFVMTICLIILLVQLGPSALAGFALFLIIIPLQERVMSFQFRTGKKALRWTDQRAKIILEVLGAMRVVKYFCYEQPFLKRIFEVRHNELKGTRKIQIARSANIAAAFSVPVLAATISFLLRQPLMFLPRALSATTDAQNALVRLVKVFHAEVRTPEDVFAVDPDQKFAVDVRDATFEWEESKDVVDLLSAPTKGEKKDKEKDKDKASAPPTPNASAPFQIKNVTMAVSRGTLVAIVGSVGSGKSSLLQGLIGEMRKVKGHVSFGGRVAYCSQTAWIQNATLRENILFGQEYDEDRYWKAVEQAALLPDLQLLADGDLTEIGEKGINLSGGQKQRVNIARALYYNADVVIFDDPLSAVDAHVGKALFADAIIGALRNNGKTIMLNGRIEEQGTYVKLVANGKEFARLMSEYGGESKDEEEEAEEEADVTEAAKQVAPAQLDIAKNKAEAVQRKGAGTGKLEGRLMVKEKRTTGSVSWAVYGDYLKAANAYWTGPLLVLCMVAMQGSSIMNSYTLVWWQENTWNRPNSFYQILYGCLGVGQSLFTFGVGSAMDEMGFFVSQNLHHHSIRNIFYAPMSFFDTTPMGRILSVFGKDIENIDNQLPVVLTISNVVGSVVLITVVEHYFIIAAAVLALGYSYFAGFYRASARELKRLDNILRSLLYAHFSESLSGLSTIRSYGEVDRFVRDNEYYIDLEDRAAYLTITNQRWLAIRLDFLGGIMTFIVAVLAVSNATGINAAQIGLVLTYTTSLTQLCAVVTRQSAEVENYMSSVERILQYSREDVIVQEAPHEIPGHKPIPEWPAKGAIEFNDVHMRYRPGLPLVLRGLSMQIHGGEKIGVVGRTGAGKSTLMLALFRIVELASGSIKVDGVDISKIGLKDLRSKISIIPQDPLLFSGTIRSNLDPFNLYADAELWDALHRSFLVESPKAAADGIHTPTSRFNLDTVIDSEGSNLSVGERSLLSLARALVKDSQVVDLETDAKIQHTIQTQFRHKTLLCIAHRLRTIISYDRILVLDSGKIAEFDSPRNLFNVPNSIFRGMCERSGITLDEIERIRSKMA
ncbi:P-loop containing nucleoside triphosphate hydrolase protein [Ganoderma leucocontextum]|nr:P-loop containing nucleoside triphosphate hydrolase protein [Ganoderma leucocontextum]